VLKYERSVSAVDKNATNTFSGLAVWSLTEHWDYQLELGVSKNEAAEDNSLFFGLGVGYWY